MKRIEIDRAKCIGAGLCFSTAPERFDLDDDGKVTLPNGDQVTADVDGPVADAVAVCPVGAITIVVEQ